MPNLASLIREAEQMRNAVRIVGPEPDRFSSPSFPAPESAGTRQTADLLPNPVRSESSHLAPSPPEISQESLIRLTEDQMNALRSAIAPPPEVMTLEEAAVYLRVGRSSILGLIHEDGLPAVKIAGKWRFKRSAVDRWLDNQLDFSPHS